MTGTETNTDTVRLRATFTVEYNALVADYSGPDKIATPEEMAAMDAEMGYYDILTIAELNDDDNHSTFTVEVVT